MGAVAFGRSGTIAMRGRDPAEKGYGAQAHDDDMNETLSNYRDMHLKG